MHKLKFVPGSSVIHRLYPLTKLIWLILGSIAFFLLSNGWLLLFIALTFLLVLSLLNLHVFKIRGFRFTLMTGAMLLILYLLFDKSGTLLFHPGIDGLRITSGGFSLGLRISSRFLAVIFLSYIFILTTDPVLIAYSLMKIGLPYRFGFMLVTALRLAPLMEEEGKTIYQAQLVRGIRYDRANFRKIPLLTQQFITPLLVSAIRRADKLVFSMEGRGFGQYDERTFLARTTPTKLDFLISILLTLLFTSSLYLNYWVLQ